MFVLIGLTYAVINYFGVRWFARINNALVAWKLFIILLVIVAFLVSAFHGSNFSSFGFAPEGIHGVFTAIATSGIVFSYLGFRQGIELAGETDNPKRNVPIDGDRLGGAHRRDLRYCSRWPSSARSRPSSTAEPLCLRAR